VLTYIICKVICYSPLFRPIQGLVEGIEEILTVELEGLVGDGGANDGMNSF
jgi:hypothetical protein